MENDITKYAKAVTLATKLSKSGKEYFVLRVVFSNGYMVENFVTQDQLFILNSMLNSSH